DGELLGELTASKKFKAMISENLSWLEGWMGENLGRLVVREENRALYEKLFGNNLDHIVGMGPVVEEVLRSDRGLGRLAQNEELLEKLLSRSDVKRYLVESQKAQQLVLSDLESLKGI